MKTVWYPIVLFCLIICIDLIKESDAAANNKTGNSSIATVIITTSKPLDNSSAELESKLINSEQEDLISKATNSCICGIFLSSQIVKKKQPPRGDAVLMREIDEPLGCGSAGLRTCINKCLDIIVKHLPESPNIICASIDHDCYKEKAHLYVKNCGGTWSGTNLSASKEYCCKDGRPYKCLKNNS